MPNGFELLEDRRTFLSSHPGESQGCFAHSGRSVAMPLIHEKPRSRRKPPLDQEQWLEVEFRVDEAPVRLWGGE